VISCCALVNVYASISSRISFETRETLTVESSESIGACSLTATNERILRTLVDVTALDEFAAKDDSVETRLALADERTVGVLASRSNIWAVTIDGALVNVFTIGCVDDTLVTLDAFARERTIVVEAVFKV